MCGLTLVVNKYSNGFTDQQRDIFYSLLYLSGGFRGRDGAGVTLVDNIGNVKIAKSAQSVDGFIHTPEYKHLYETAFRTGWAMIGHNRAATRGVVSDENSHPFWVDDKIVLVHNGTFNGDHKHHKDTAVDSEAIAHVLAENDDVEQALRKINAAYALMWYNAEKKQINVIRNWHRPLWWIEIDSCYIFSSERIFLDFAIDRFRLKPDEDPHELPEFNLTTFTLTEKKTTEVDGQVLDASYYKHNPSPKTDYYEGYGNYRGYGVQNKQNDPFTLSTWTDAILSKAIKMFNGKLQKTTNGEWSTLMSTQKYLSQFKAKILIEDAEEIEKDGDSFIFTGKTLDDKEIPVLFIEKNITYSEAVGMLGHGLFEITIQGLQWKRQDELFPVDMKQDIAEWPGIILLHGMDPKPINMEQTLND